jgi:hypothetical protein
LHKRKKEDLEDADHVVKVAKNFPCAQFEEEKYAEIRKRENSREYVDSQLNEVLESGRKLYVSFLVSSCFFFFFFQTYQVILVVHMESGDVVFTLSMCIFFFIVKSMVIA